MNTNGHQQEEDASNGNLDTNCVTNNDLSKDYLERLEEHRSRLRNVCKKGITQQELVENYSNWAKDESGVYRIEESRPNKYTGPRVVAETLAECVPRDAREGYEILDVGAGAGLVAKELRQFGFETMDAIDPCEALLENAKERGRYRNYFCEFVTGKPISLDDDSYDAVVTSGCFAEGHIPCAAVHNFIRVVRPGGYVVIVTRWVYVQEAEEYRDRLEPLMQELERDGKWQCLVREIFPEYTKDFEGIKWVFKVL